MRRVRRLLAAVAVVWAGSARADFGRIEISQHMIPYTISESGSYVVTENLTATGLGSAISVEASFVMLDLNGHAVRGAALGHGIAQGAAYDHLVVRNGRVAAPGAGYAIHAEGVFNRFTDLECFDFGLGAIKTGRGSVIVNCSVRSNAVQEVGSISVIETGGGSLVVDCAVRDVVVSGARVRGIRGTGSGVLVKGCRIGGNNSTAGTFFGISVTNGAVIADCSIEGNSGFSGFVGIQGGDGIVTADSAITRNQSSVATNNVGMTMGNGQVVSRVKVTHVNRGIVAGNAAVIAGCTVVADASLSPEATIEVNDGCAVLDCAVFGWADILTGNGNLVAGCTTDGGGIRAVFDGFIVDNAINSDSAGVTLVSGWSRVDNNKIEGSTDVSAGGGRSLIIRNSSRTYTESGTSDDHTARTLTGTVNFSTAEPFANISHSP